MGAGLALALVIVALSASSAFGGKPVPASAQADGTPKFTTDGGTTGFRTANTIKYWSSSFVDGANHQPYSYTMVGTPPSSGSLTTTPTVIIPLAFHFSAAARPDPRLVCAASGQPGTCVALDVTMDPMNDTTNRSPGHSNDAVNVLDSPIFTPTAFPLSNDTNVQYGDAIQRSEFNVVNSGYHVNLQNQTVYPVTTIDVPANQGVAVINRRGVLVGRIDETWFSNQLNSAINSLHVPATTLPIILNANVFLYGGNDQVFGCCILGYHGARSSVRGGGAQAVQTYMFAAYITPGSFGGYPTVPIADIHGLSHEVSEWMNDPFVNNLVNPWTTGDPSYGCTGYLETGDPVVGVGFDVTMPNSITYHPEDEVFLPWFASQDPNTTSQDGRYTYMSTFDTTPTHC
jgi:hypothetical protein